MLPSTRVLRPAKISHLDRGLICELVYGIVRRQRSLDSNKRVSQTGGVVNGILRAYGREADHRDPLQLPADPVERLGVRHSFPDWIVKIWLERLGAEQSNRLLAHFNETPKIDLRVNTHQQQIDNFLWLTFKI